MLTGKTTFQRVRNRISIEKMHFLSGPLVWAKLGKISIFFVSLIHTRNSGCLVEFCSILAVQRQVNRVLVSHICIWFSPKERKERLPVTRWQLKMFQNWETSWQRFSEPNVSRWTIEQTPVKLWVQLTQDPPSMFQLLGLTLKSHWNI